jgi:hypothetical protein
MRLPGPAGLGVTYFKCHSEEPIFGDEESVTHDPESATASMRYRLLGPAGLGVTHCGGLWASCAIP